ncbi:nucleotidyltransferase family protein [Phenylobacterium sp. VNQ135]|uniref:nucleotidyltransferase family protein n=1 Tax=Phenylobacterium sp. VNQ135 TaxID=3400922 RepID=UPI003C0E3321
MTKALVLAAGLGSRIRGVTGAVPKPLAPIGGAPILAHNLAWLARSGIDEVWINLHYQGDLIRHAVGDGAAFGLKVHYVFEPDLLGTAGALRNLPPAAEEPMWVVYGDNLVRFDLAALEAAHRAAKAEVTIALFDPDTHANTGIAGGRVRLAADGSVEAFVEGAAATTGLVNAGVYLAEPTVLDLIPPGRLVDFGREVFPAMLAQGRRLRGHVMEPAGFCLGFDTPESFANGQALIARGAVDLS